MPDSQTASVAIIPGPPEFVMIATLLPLGIGQLENAFAFAKRFLRENSLMTPDWCKSAAAALSAPAKEPVCELAAEAPAALRPALSARMGFFFVILEASFLKFCGFWMDSIYRRICFTSSSFSQYSSIVSALMSA